jgi:hypothetical protein
MSGFSPKRSHRRPWSRGVKVHLLKRDRGVRAGKFLVFLEIESLEARDWYFPRPGEEPEEFRIENRRVDRLRRRR